MEINKEHIGNYLQKSVLYLFKSKLVFFIISLIECIELLVCLVNFEEVFFYFNKNYFETNTLLKTILSQISPFLKYYDFQKVSDGKGFDRNYVTIIIYLVFIIFFYIYLFFGTKERKNKKNNIKTFLDKICINFYDFIFFRLLPLYGFDCITRGIFRISAKNNYNLIDIIIQFILLIFFSLCIFTHLYYFRNVCIWNNFKVVNSYIDLYPYERFYSQKYDLVFFLLKVLIATTNSYLEYNNNYLNIIVIFLSVVFIFIYYTFSLFTFFLVFVSKDSLYIYMNFSNRLRIFYILLILECLLLRLCLHASGDYIPYLVYLAILIVFNIYLVTAKFNIFLYTNANTSQNFLAVCWFVQSNEINKQDFIIEWISNHKIKCSLDSSDCPICSKLKIDFDIYSDKHLLELKRETAESQFLNLNNKFKIKNELTKNEKRTLISNMFPPFIFFNALINLAEKYKKGMTEDDLIRLDFIHLTTLFLNEERDIDFIIFNKICHCLIKYQKSSQILTTFLLIFNLIRTSEKFCNQKYEILQKNEELRNSLTIYLKEYEDFILYKEKSPINYYDISCKYKSFKDLLVTIHMYFKKNIECNYELILMRYIYEALINSKKSYHIQPFDLNNYSEFLEFHFTNSRTFLLKYKIEQELFFIIKASKEILKYQGSRFCLIFPEELREVALKKFKSQLNDIEEKESKHIFEFLIESNLKNYGFVESFKMNYVIYPTNMINELFIQANYRISYNNLIIFLNSNNGDESLFSFSFQLYKFFALTPQDVSLLYNYGIPILFQNLFIKKNNVHSQIQKDKDNIKEKVEYIFKYKFYVMILKRILSFDIMKESPNFSAIQEKEKQFELLAKEDKEVVFHIYKKWECKNELKTYNIYTIKEIKKKRLKKNLGDKELKSKSGHSQFNDNDDEKSALEGEESENDDEDKNEFDYGEEMFEGKGMTMAGSIMSSASYSRTSSMDSSKQKGKKDEKAEEKKAKQQQLYKTVYIILGFGIMLIIISVIFLIMENIENNNFKNSIELFHTFHIFKRGIETMPLTILANYKYEIISITTNNLYEDYCKDLGKKYDLLSKVPLSEILLIDTQEKLSTIISSFNDYQKEIHLLGEDISKQIADLKGVSYKLKVEGDKLFFYKLEISLISLGREYLNILSVLLENNAFLDIFFSMMSSGPLVNNVRTMDRSRIGEISELKKNMILLLLTYPFLYNGLFTISTFILDQADRIVKSITYIYIIFYTILFILHLILCGIGIIFLISFIKILKLSIMNGNKLFENKQFLEFQEKRLTQIKIMKNLYSENPIKVMDKIESIDDIYKNKNKEQSKRRTNDIQDIQELEYDKNYGKDEDKLKSNDNDLLSKSNSQKSTRTKKMYNNTLGVKSAFSGVKTINPESDKNNNNNTNNINNNSINNSDKTEFSSISINQNVSSMNKKMKFSQFNKIILFEFIILFFSFFIYFIYSIAMLVLVIFGINRLYYLIDYCKYNDLIDGYLYDNTNAMIYIINTNSSSQFYGSLIDSSNTNTDYIKEKIDLVYEAITKKNDIEYFREPIILPTAQIYNVNCSAGIVQDESLINIVKRYNLSYDEYFGQLCKEFPVASTGVPASIFYEIIYLVGKIYRKYEQENSFYELFNNNLNQTLLYDLFTITFTFFRIQRNYFYNNIIMKEVYLIIDYFSELILIYLVISIVFEVIIFLLLYFGIIRQVKKKDSLFGNFIDSFKFD